MKQGLKISVADSGDVLVTVTTIYGNTTIRNFIKVDQLEFCRQVAPVIQQLSPQYRDGITDILPGVDNHD